MADGSLFNEIMLEEKLVELWSDYSCLLLREIAGSQELGETLGMFVSCFVIKGATIARIF